MTIVISGPARIPGPFGTNPVTIDDLHPTMPGDFRGPVGYRPLYDTKTGGRKSQTAPPKKIHSIKMPHAFDKSGTTTKIARVVDWPLFAKGGPKPTDISQGTLPNCPLPTILAAMANTADGSKRIADLVKEHDGDVVTDLSDVLDDISDQTDNVASKRYFTVTLSKTTEVTDVFYTDDADQGWAPLYMQGPDSGAHVLWPLVIEKGYAVMLGGYAKLDEMQVNAVWKEVMGAAPRGFSITPKTDPERIREQAQEAMKKPVILASKDDKSIEKASGDRIIAHHGYAVLGIHGNIVKLYNPWGKAVDLPLVDIPKFFQAMFYP